jgi:hypothetical protein
MQKVKAMSTSDLKTLRENCERAEKAKDWKTLAAIAGVLIGLIEIRGSKHCQGDCMCAGKHKEE